MEDFLKDFEFYGFESELDMVTKVVEYANESTKEIRDEESGTLVSIKERPFREILNNWFDDNAEDTPDKYPDGTVGMPKPFAKPGIFQENS